MISLTVMITAVMLEDEQKIGRVPEVALAVCIRGSSAVRE